MTYEEIKNNEVIKTYIKQANESLDALGYTEHGFAHVTLVAETAGYILKTMGVPERTVELVKIAGYLHDIGNLVKNYINGDYGNIVRESKYGYYAIEVQLHSGDFIAAQHSDWSEMSPLVYIEVSDPQSGGGNNSFETATSIQLG